MESTFDSEVAARVRTTEEDDRVGRPETGPTGVVGTALEASIDG